LLPFDVAIFRWFRQHAANQKQREALMRYCVQFVATFDVLIDAEDVAKARDKAASMAAECPLFALVGLNHQSKVGWNIIEPVGGDDD
jgi:hypothetical protein